MEQYDPDFTSASGETPSPDEVFDVAASASPRESGVLCVGFDAGLAAWIGRALDARAIRHDETDTIAEVMRHVVSSSLDLVLVSSSVDVGSLAPVVAQAKRIASATRVVVVGDRPGTRTLLEAMRAGISDWIDPADGHDTLDGRIAAALELAREERTRDARIARLKGICRKLSITREEFSSQLDSLSEGLAQAAEEARERADDAAAAGELRGLLSQELDVEDLLRTTLQYFLTKTGATNAAVFLPGSRSDQFGLGAYVNYDCPRATAQPLLTRLAEEVCPRLAAGDDIVRFDDTDEFVEAVGFEAAVLEDAELIAWPARHGDECMGVFFLFRSRSEPFRDELAGLIDVLRPVFAAQMAKLVRIHHRSRFQWPEAASDESSVDEDADGHDGQDGDEWRRAA